MKTQCEDIKQGPPSYTIIQKCVMWFEKWFERIQNTSLKPFHEDSKVHALTQPIFFLTIFHSFEAGIANAISSSKLRKIIILKKKYTSLK